MRNRYDKNGKLIGAHKMVFDTIPDDYKMKSVYLKSNENLDLSYLGIMKDLRKIYKDKELSGNDLGIEFQDEEYVTKEVIEHLALDYIESAKYLRKGVNDDRGQSVASYYEIPCAYLCRHSIELILKRCLLARGITQFCEHSVKTLWDKLDAKGIPHYGEITTFINEVEQLDKNEEALRYGVDKKLQLFENNLHIDVDILLCNTMFLFNVVDEHIICKRFTNEVEE